MEVLLKQIVFASNGATDEEILKFVQDGFRTSYSILFLLKDVIGVEEVEVLNGFSSPVSAPSVSPSLISDGPTLLPTSNTSSPSLKSSLKTTPPSKSYDFNWNMSKYYTDGPPRLNDIPVTIPNKTVPEFDVIPKRNTSQIPASTETQESTSTIPVVYIAAIAASTSIVIILVIFLLYFFTRKNNARKKREQPSPAPIKAKKPAIPPPVPFKVPHFIDIEEMQSVDESTIGEHTAGRNPDKKIRPLLPIPSESQHSKGSQKQRKPLSLNVDYEEDNVYPNLAHTPGTASPSLSSNSRPTPRANTRKSNNQLVLSNMALNVSPPKPAPVQPLISPVTFYDQESPQLIYDDPDPEPVVMSSDSESEPEKTFSGTRFIPRPDQPKPYQKKYKPQLSSFSSSKSDVSSKNHAPKPPKHKNDDQGSNDSKEGENPWLFEAVQETLGPRGVSADMESLGERSRHSHKSRSSKHRRKKGGSSVGSRGSKTSLKSYRSQISKTPSEASRSVAMDLMRLENQLNSISKSDSTVSVHSHTSKSTSASKRRTMRNFIKVKAPPGKLGVILANRTDKPGTVVSDVRPSSPLHGKIFPGDRIVSIDGENVSMIPVSEITIIMARKAEFQRVLTVLTFKNGLKL